MRALFGLGNHNIYQVQQTFKQNTKDLRLQVLGFDSEVKPKADAILIPTVALFNKHRKVLNDMDVVVFIFDTPVLLEYLKPIKVLDVKKIASYRYVFTELNKDALLGCLKAEGKVQVSQDAVDVIPRMLNATFPSIMKPILNFLYSIPNTDKRILYRFQLLRFLAKSTLSIKDLEKALIRLSPKGIDKAPFKELIEFFNSQQVTNTRTVLREVRAAKKAGKTPNVNKLCEKYQVSPFDVKYINKAYSADKRNFVMYKDGKTTEQVFKEHHEKKTAAKATK